MSRNDTANFENTAYMQLKQAIIKGVYPPGSQIIEESIASQLSMSRSPVRSAIKRLETEGFLEKRTNRRMYVTHGNNKKALDALYIRKALEGVAAYQAAKNFDEEDAKALCTALEEMKESSSSGDSFRILRLGTDIHKLIYAAAKNDQLARLGVNILEQVSLFSYRSLNTGTARVQASYREHAALIEAILSRNAALAEQKAREHVDVLIDIILRSRSEEQGTSSLLIQY